MNFNESELIFEWFEMSEKTIQIIRVQVDLSFDTNKTIQKIGNLIRSDSQLIFVRLQGKLKQQCTILKQEMKFQRLNKTHFFLRLLMPQKITQL